MPKARIYYKILPFLFAFIFFSTVGCAQAWSAEPEWETQGLFYFLAKNDKKNFSAWGPGSNVLPRKYLTYDKVAFLVRGPAAWTDYGRLDLDGNNTFQMPIRAGIKVEEIHFLASGHYGNNYEHDALLRLYGENYYYSVLTVTFVYQDGVYKNLSAPVFWDWFHLPPIPWSKDGVASKPVGINPVRPKCTMYHISFDNPRPDQPVKDILVSDSWLSDRPFSDVFAVTIKSPDSMPASPRKD